MGAKRSSATMVPAEDLRPATPRRGGRKRRPREVGPVSAPAKSHGNEARADLAILNRNARRLNREARDVLGFQVRV